MINYPQIARSLGFETERSMWQSLYEDDHLSIQQLSDRLSLGQHTVQRRLAICGIPTRTRGGNHNVFPQREKLFHMDQRAIWSNSNIDLSRITDISEVIISKYKRVNSKGGLYGFLHHITNSRPEKVLELKPHTLSTSAGG